jgi:hypothetical protein
MADFVLPVLGLGDEQSSPVTVVWKDGTVLCRGILGSSFDPVEHARKEELRSHDNVALLEDYKS